MKDSPLSVDVFPAWARLNDVSITGLRLEDVEGKGFGFVAGEELISPPTGRENDIPHLLRVPRDLILSREAVDDYAKVDQNFRQLLDVAGRQVMGPENGNNTSFADIS